MHYDVGMIWSATTSSIAAYFASSPTFGLYPTLEGNNKGLQHKIIKLQKANNMAFWNPLENLAKAHMLKAVTQ